MAHPTNEVVTLNVGGQKFQTTMKTLANTVLVYIDYAEYDYKFSDEPVAILKDSEGFNFVDRDPEHFRLILNFLRDGTVQIPEDGGGALELKQEAEFYRIDALVKLIEQTLLFRRNSILNV